MIAPILLVPRTARAAPYAFAFAAWAATIAPTITGSSTVVVSFGHRNPSVSVRHRNPDVSLSHRNPNVSVKGI